MTLTELVEVEIHNLMVRAAKIAAEELSLESPEVAAIPLVFFAIEQRLCSCWRAALAEILGGGVS